MEVYLCKEVDAPLAGTEAACFAAIRLNFEPEFAEFSGYLSLEKFNKFWKL